MNRYKWLPPEPQRKEPEIDLFPDSQEGDSKAGFSSYLDEFLSAIKVFGYLERPVFHELTRSMQTRKLIAGRLRPTCVGSTGTDMMKARHCSWKRRRDSV